MDIDDLNPIQQDEATLDRVVSRLEEAIWTRDTLFMRALGTEDFAATWGGPSTEEVRAAGRVVYYLDGQWAYLWFIRELTTREEAERLTLRDLHSKATTLDDLLKHIVQQVHRCYPDIKFGTLRPWAK